MRNLLFKLCVSAATGLAAGAASANEELIKMAQNPKDWVMPTGNYANHRYSQLKQSLNRRLRIKVLLSLDARHPLQRRRCCRTRCR